MPRRLYFEILIILKPSAFHLNRLIPEMECGRANELIRQSFHPSHSPNPTKAADNE